MKTTLIADKKTEYVIVIPACSAPVEQTAAEELQGYLKKALGAELAIKKEDEAAGKAFYIGHTDYAKNAGVLGKSKENWIIKMVDENLILTGGTKENDRGILYAVYHFLEDIVGVRWWNYWEEDVLKLSELSLASDFCKEGTPAFYYRKPIHYGAFKDFYFDARTRTNVVSGDDGLEDGVYHPSIKKLGGAMPMGRPHHVHTLGQYFPPEETFSEHPDWFAWSAFQNKRVSYGHYCLTNEEYIEALTNKVLAYVEEDHRLAEETGVELPDFYSISFPDVNEGFCQCDACKAALEKSGASGYAIQFVNEIARRVAEKYPDVKIETLVYAIYLDKPLDDTLPEKNVIIRLAQVYVDIIHSIYDKGNQWYLRLLKDWSDICKRAGCTLYIWEYMYQLFFDMPAPVPNRISDTYRAFHEYGVEGVFVENECLTADMWELTHYMLTHMAEDPYQDADALIEDFMTRFYGPAAPYMKAYYDTLVRASEENNYSVFCIVESVHFNYLDAKAVKRGMELLEKAMDAVRDDAVFGPRVQYSQAILGGTLLIKYHDLKKNAALHGITFEYDREAVRKMVLEGYQAAAKLPRIGENSIRIRNTIQYYENMDLGEEEKPALPAELSDVNPDDVYQFLFKNMCRHICNGGRFYNYSVVDDPDSSTGRVSQAFMEESKHATMALALTSKHAEHKRSIEIFIEQDAKPVCGVEIYREDIVPNEYHLYKVGSASGIRESSDTRVNIFGINYEWVSLTGISVAFPMDACDVYISLKFTGEMYGGSKEDKDIVFFDRAIIVRK